MADRESILAWLNEKSYRYVYPKDPVWKIVQRLCSEGRAVQLGTSSRYAITKAGHASLPESPGSEDP